MGSGPVFQEGLEEGRPPPGISTGHGPQTSPRRGRGRKEARRPHRTSLETLVPVMVLELSPRGAGIGPSGRDPEP